MDTTESYDPMVFIQSYITQGDVPIRGNINYDGSYVGARSTYEGALVRYYIRMSSAWTWMGYGMALAICYYIMRT